MVRVSARLAASAPETAPVVAPPKASRTTKKSAAAKAAAEATEKAAAEAAAAAAEASKSAANIEALRIRQRQASARYYAKKRAAIVATRAATYAATTGQARKANPPVVRQTFNAPAHAIQQQRYEQPHHTGPDEQPEYPDEQQYDEMPFEPHAAPQGNYHPPPSVVDLRPRPTGRALILPPVPQSTVLTEKFIKAWLRERDPPGPDGVARESQYNGAVSALRITFEFTDLRTVIYDVDPTLTAIATANKKAHTEENPAPYSPASKLKMVQLLLLLIEHLPVAVPPATLQLYRNGYKENKIEETDARAAREKELASAVMPYGKYKREVSRIFGAASKEAMLVDLYGEVPCRDNYGSMTIVHHGAKLAAGRNYVVAPETENGTYTIVLQNYKTSGKYGRLDAELTPGLSNQVRTYIRNNNLKVGGHLFGDKKLSGFVGGINRALGIPKSAINYIRHSIISTAFTDTTMTASKRRVLLERMGHSIEMQVSYKRVIEAEALEDADAPEPVKKPRAPTKKALEKAAAKAAEAKAASTKQPAKKRKRKA